MDALMNFVFKYNLKFPKSNLCNNSMEIHPIPVPSTHFEKFSFNFQYFFPNKKVACGKTEYTVCTLLVSLTMSIYEDHPHSLVTALQTILLFIQLISY